MALTTDYIFCFIGGALFASLIWLWARQQLAARLARSEAESQSRASQLATLQANHQELSAARLQDREMLGRAEAEAARLRHELSEGQARHESQKQAFESLSRETLERQADQLAASQNERLHQLLTPLRDRIREFEQKVEASYHSEARERFALKKEIEQLSRMNIQLGDEARNLTRALKGDSKTQGAWGELVLERALELSGLREGAEYTLQAQHLDLRDTEGRRLQPDALIHLPGEKHLIIDAKVSLTAYERYLTAETEAERNRQLRLHLDSVRNHIQQLSAKNYPQLKGLQAPEFVFLFLAIEPAFSLAVQHEPALFAYAWDRQILLVGPATFLAALKTAASLWNLDRQNQHAREIARQGGLLYDKFASLVEDLQKTGEAIGKAAAIHEEAMRKLHTGKGNLLARADKLRKLGAPVTKSLHLFDQELASMSAEELPGDEQGHTT